MKRLFIIFVLIYLNLPDRYCTLPDNILKVDSLGAPSPYELIWITTASHCNEYNLVYKMLIGVGLPIKKQIYTNEEMATYLIPDSLYEEEPVIDSPYKFLKFREISQNIENFVFEIKTFQNVAEAEDIDTGLSIWQSIEENMINFINNIYMLSNQVKQVLNKLTDDSNTQQNDNPLAMMNLYLNAFEQIVSIVSDNINSYKNAFNFIEKYNSKNNKQTDVKQELKEENKLDSRAYTRAHLAEVYELYIEALISFYNSKSVDSVFSNSDFVLWYDLNSSKSILDIASSKHLTHVIKLREYIQEVYKYNKTNVPKITSKVQEYVSANLYNIAGLLKAPLQKILKDEYTTKSDVALSSAVEYGGAISIDGLFSANREALHAERTEKIQTTWNDSSVTIVARDIVDRYNKSSCDVNIDKNVRLMYWAEQMSIDEQKKNILESSVYAMMVLKNLENVVLCSDNDSDTDTEDDIENLIVDADQKLNAIYKYSVYPITDGRENIISDLWNDIIDQKNNIFNILDWLDKSAVPRTNVPYWPNDTPCNDIYMKNILQLASVSSDMLYDVTLTSMYKALEMDGIDDELEEAEAEYMLEDLERAKHTYKYVIQNLKNLIKINTLFVKSNALLSFKLKRLAIHELAKYVKYKMFAITEYVIPAFRKIQYYNSVRPAINRDYSEHFAHMNGAFFRYFGKKTEPADETAAGLIKSYERTVISIYNRLRQKNLKTKKGSRYARVLKYNMISAKRVYHKIIKELKKITLLNDEKGLENNYGEVKQRLVIAVALVMGDFIRFDKYVERQPQTIRLFNRKFQYTISEIDIAKQNVNIDYEKIFNKINRKQYCRAKKKRRNAKLSAVANVRKTRAPNDMTAVEKFSIRS